jgi:hypothetical protein
MEAYNVLFDIQTDSKHETDMHKFSSILKPLKKSRYQKGHMKQVPNLGPTAQNLIVHMTQCLWLVHLIYNILEFL